MKAVEATFNQEKALVGAFSLLRDCEKPIVKQIYRFTALKICDHKTHGICSNPNFSWHFCDSDSDLPNAPQSLSMESAAPSSMVSHERWKNRKTPNLSSDFHRTDGEH